MHPRGKDRTASASAEQGTGNDSLRIERVEKSFGGAGQVLEPLSFEVSAGGWTTILGPSGCGKTTLLRILAGLLEPDNGSVSTTSGRSLLAATAYLPQQDTLLPWRTALDNAVLAPELAGLPLTEARDRAVELFEHFDLAGFETAYPSQLSGGMRQRVALIRTFLSDRDILLLDEPLGALDPLTRTKLQDWLLRVWDELGKTILLVTHDVEEALYLSDRVLVLSSRPARIRDEIAVDAPRPRSRADAGLAARRLEILELLLREVA